MSDDPGGGLPPGDNEDIDLRRSLASLAGLVNSMYSLEELLGQVATFAVQAIPHADGAGVTLLRIEDGRRRVEALASSAPFVAEIDELQYAVLDEGPCITAAEERRTVRSGSLGGEPLWPRFGPRVGRLGVNSALSLPLLLPEQRVVGAINVYSHGHDRFDEHAEHFGELFAAPAAVAVHNAQVLEAARQLARQLQTALTSRPLVDQAIGLLRGRSGVSEAEALATLKQISQRENTKLVEVASTLVAQAEARARAVHGGDHD